MPKKTKKEKIIAELRRKLETTQTVSQKWETKNTKPDTENTFKLPTTQNIPPQAQLSHITLPNSSPYLVKDLQKTFILAGLAISFEFIVYLIWH